MKSEKIKHPWARCIECGDFFDDDKINQKCPSVHNGIKCKGVVKSELRPNTWFECQECGATGKLGDIECRFCNGKGWLFTEVFWK